MINHLLPANRSKAPRKKLRGRKRYLRKLPVEAQTKELEVGESAWYDHWHYHPDWYGYGNLSWHMRAQHLKALAAAFKAFAVQLSWFSKPFQLFVYLNADNSSQDAVFVHTPNPNRDNFPAVFDEAEWGFSNISYYFATMLPAHKFRAGSMKWQGTDVYFIYSPDVGVSIEKKGKQGT